MGADVYCSNVHTKYMVRHGNGKSSIYCICTVTTVSSVAQHDASLTSGSPGPGPEGCCDTVGFGRCWEGCDGNGWLG